MITRIVYSLLKRGIPLKLNNKCQINLNLCGISSDRLPLQNFIFLRRQQESSHWQARAYKLDCDRQSIIYHVPLLLR